VGFFAFGKKKPKAKKERLKVIELLKKLHISVENGNVTERNILNEECFSMKRDK